MRVHNRFDLKKMKQLIDSESADFGELFFNQFLSAHHLFKKAKNLQVLGNQIDSLTFLILNVKSDIFKEVATRNYIYKKVFDNFQLSVPELYSLKANQYFLPGAKGHLDHNIVKQLVSSMKIKRPKTEKIKILSFDTLKAIVPEDIEKNISSAIEMDVEIDFSAKTKDNKQIKLERKFDAFLLTTSMSLKVLSETLNYAYSKDNPSFTDPTGNIALYLASYLKNKNDFKYIELIIKQMILDSECIPLFYHMTPVFFNRTKFKMDSFNYNESIQPWKFDLQ